MSKYLTTCPSCGCRVNIEGDLPDVIQCGSCRKRLKLLKPEKEPPLLDKIKQISYIGAKKIKLFPSKHPTATKTLIAGFVFAFAAITANHKNEIIDTLLKSVFPEAYDRAQFEHWLETCSDEELNQAYDEINGIWIENCIHRTGSNERSYEQDQMLNELNRRYAIRCANDPEIQNRPHVRWTDEARWDRD